MCALLREAGLAAQPNPSFNPKRAAVVVPKDGDTLLGGVPLVYTPDEKYSVNPAGVAAAQNVVCKCEKVTEAEVVDACRRSLPIDSTQAIRKRTRAGMGGCQGKPWNYNCECRVAQIISREQEQPLSVEAVGRRPWSATSQFPRRWLSDGDKERLDALAAPDEPTKDVDPSEVQVATEKKIKEALPMSTSPASATVTAESKEE